MTDYSQIPQRLHKYPASDRAKQIVQQSMTIDRIFSGCWPMQWSSPEVPEFHDEMGKIIAAGFKVIGACPSADGVGSRDRRDRKIGGGSRRLAQGQRRRSGCAVWHNSSADRRRD